MKYIVSIFLFLEFFFVPNLAYGFDWENDFDKRNQTNNFLFELTDLSAALDACGEYDLSIRALNIANETIEVLFKQDIINTNITLDLKTLVTETNFRLINQYRSKKLSLEKINRFESIQKEDMLSLKIFTEDKYCTLSIHIDGTLDFIIKKEEGDKNISSKDDLVNLFKISNYIIDKINDENKYSEIKLENFGENLDETFYQDIEFKL